MKMDPGKLGRVFQQLIALKGMPICVVDQNDQRYKGRLQFDGEYVVQAVNVILDTPKGNEQVLRVEPLIRIQEILGSTITANLSRIIEVWIQSPAGIEELLFFESEVDRIKSYKAKAGDKKHGDDEEPIPDMDDYDESKKTLWEEYNKSHYLMPTDTVRSIHLTPQGFRVWVDRRTKLKR